MSRTRISLEEMTSLTNRWVQAGTPENMVMLKYGVLVALLPDIKLVQQQLLGAQKTDSGRATELATQAVAMDGEHDGWVVAIVKTSDALAPVADPSLQLPALREWLFPRGLMHARDSYQAEIGHALHIESELTAEKKKLLKAVVFASHTLLQMTQAWIASAHKLQEIEFERKQLAPSGGDPISARRAWLTAVRGLEAAAKVAKVTPEDQQVLFGQLLDTEKRRSNRPKKSTGTTVPPAAQLPEGEGSSEDGSDKTSE